MGLNIFVRGIDAVLKNLRYGPQTVSPKCEKNSYILKIAGLARKEDLIAIRSDGEIPLIHASGNDVPGEEPGAVARRCLSKIIAPYQEPPV